MAEFTTRDLALAAIAKRHGANYALRIIIEARKYRVPISLALALIEQESGFRNVFGHDPTNSIPVKWRGSKVTKDKYKYYKTRRSMGMQGVGPAQLTWWEYQDLADRRGGCWIPKHNISVAMDHLGSMLVNSYIHHALKAYNGTGDAAERYAVIVKSRMDKWHTRLS